MSVVLSCPGCGNLLWHPQESNTDTNGTSLKLICLLSCSFFTLYLFYSHTKKVAFYAGK